MPIVTKINNAERPVWAEASGVLVLDDILECFDTIVVEEAMAYAKVFDAQECSIQLSDPDMMELGARVSAYGAFEPRGPVAIVLPAGRGWDTAQRFLNLGGATRPAQVFKTKDEAWRGLHRWTVKSQRPRAHSCPLDSNPQLSARTIVTTGPNATASSACCRC